MTVVTVFYRVVALATLAGNFPLSFLLLKHLLPILGILQQSRALANPVTITAD